MDEDKKRIIRSFNRAGIHTIEELLPRSSDELLLQIPGIKVSDLRSIKDGLSYIIIHS